MVAELTVGGHEFGPVRPDFLAERLASLNSDRRAEVWLKHSAGSSICLLKSDERAMLMLLRADGDAGLVSRARDYVAEGGLRFTLSNGQEDEYPGTGTVAFDDARRAMELFWFTGAAAPFIDWQEDQET